jgi:hypothetical protein
MDKETPEERRQREDETAAGTGQAVDTRTAANREERRGTRRIRLTRSILLGTEHAETDSVHEVSRALAHRLIGEGSAVADDAGEPGDPGNATTVNRMEHPANREPEPRRISGPAPKVKK